MPFGHLIVTFGEANVGFTLNIDNKPYETISKLPPINEENFVEVVQIYAQKPEITGFHETKKARTYSLGFSTIEEEGGELREAVRIVEFRIPLDQSADGPSDKPSADDSSDKPSAEQALPNKSRPKTVTPESLEQKASNTYARRTLLTWFARRRNALNIAHAQYLIDDDRSFGRKGDNVVAIKRSIKALNATISTATEVRDRLEEVLAQHKSD